VLREGIKFRSDKDGCYCTRFITGTESCVPIRSLKEAGKLLYVDNKSWLSAYNKSSNRWELAHCFHAVERDIIPIEVVCTYITTFSFKFIVLI
jgi:hypothetical protein